jgi:transcription elongation factor Elf1
MIIELQRQWVEDGPTYSYRGGEGTRCAVCAMCGVAFEEPSVVAYATTDARGEMGVVCFECVAYLGKRNPEEFPTIEVYRELLERYPEAMYPNEEALDAAGEAAGYEDPSQIAYGPSWVWRPRAAA